MWILLNWTLKKCCGRIWIVFNWLRIEIITSTCSSSREPFENDVRITVSYK
jgi:hypothetical protein